MRKKSFIMPNIMLSAGGDKVTVIGGGTGQSTTDLTDPMRYEEWMISEYADDLYIDNVIDFTDYAIWWGYMMTLNPDAFTLGKWIELGNSEEDWYDLIIDD